MYMDMDAVRITQFTVRDFKGVELVDVEVRHNGLFIIGGACDAGKTSLLDAIMSCLGGERFVPDSPIRDGAAKGEVEVRTSNGLQVRRSFTPKGSYLTVTDPNGMRGNQGVLDKFVSLFALDAPRFMEATDKEKVSLLLKAIGVDLSDITKRREELKQERLMVGRNRDRFKAVYEQMPWDESVGVKDIEPTDLIAELDKANEVRREIDKRKAQLTAAENREKTAKDEINNISDQIEEINEQIRALQRRRDKLEADESAASKALLVISGLREEMQKELTSLSEPDTSAIKAKLEDVKRRNKIASDNRARLAKFDDYMAESARWGELSAQLAKLDEEQAAMVKGADKILPGLSVNDEGKLTYNGRTFDSLSHSDQLIVTVSICGAVKPECGFVLLDKLEAMDPLKLDNFGRWVKQKGMQVIATRVSTGPENSIIIGHGKVISEVSAVAEAYVEDVPPADDKADLQP